MPITRFTGTKPFPDAFNLRVGHSTLDELLGRLTTFSPLDTLGREMLRGLPNPPEAPRTGSAAGKPNDLKVCLYAPGADETSRATLKSEVETSRRRFLTAREVAVLLTEERMRSLLDPSHAYLLGLDGRSAIFLLLPAARGQPWEMRREDAVLPLLAGRRVVIPTAPPA